MKNWDEILKEFISVNVRLEMHGYNGSEAEKEINEEEMFDDFDKSDYYEKYEKELEQRAYRGLIGVWEMHYSEGKSYVSWTGNTPESYTAEYDLNENIKDVETPDRLICRNTVIDIPTGIIDLNAHNCITKNAENVFEVKIFVPEEFANVAEDGLKVNVLWKNTEFYIDTVLQKLKEMVNMSLTRQGFHSRIIYDMYWDIPYDDRDYRVLENYLNPDAVQKEISDFLFLADFLNDGYAESVIKATNVARRKKNGTLFRRTEKTLITNLPKDSPYTLAARNMEDREMEIEYSVNYFKGKTLDSV